MYCRSCGEQIDTNAVICVKCGVPVYTGKSFCQNCGQTTNPEQEVCLSCGNTLKKSRIGLSGSHVPSDRREWAVTLLLNIFIGYLGAHRFYTGHTAIGIAQLVTCGGCGVWAFIDLILILLGHYKDSNGNDLVK